MRDAARREHDTDRVALSQASARDRLARWLMDGPPQQREGPHAGAVAGVTDRQGAAAYVYPEITGYYLQWLAWRVHAGHGAPALASRAAAAQAWLCHWAAERQPRARIHLAPRDDWRNAGLFAFDVAMALRGIASASAVGLIVADRPLVRALDDLLQRLVASDGALDACCAYPGTAPMPRRWSTMRGPFLAKAAAGILAAVALPDVSPRVVEAARRTYVLACNETVTHAHAESHPRLYALEGVIARAHATNAPPLHHAASQVRGLIGSIAMHGFIPESTVDPGQPRRDVHAQALRAALLLDALGSAACTRDECRALAAELAAQVAPDGGIAFARSSKAGERNVWTAMFAEQALACLQMAPREIAGCAAWIV